MLKLYKIKDFFDKLRKQREALCTKRCGTCEVFMGFSSPTMVKYCPFQKKYKEGKDIPCNKWKNWLDNWWA